MASTDEVNRRPRCARCGAQYTDVVGNSVLATITVHASAVLMNNCGTSEHDIGPELVCNPCLGEVLQTLHGLLSKQWSWNEVVEG